MLQLFELSTQPSPFSGGCCDDCGYGVVETADLLMVLGILNDSAVSIMPSTYNMVQELELLALGSQGMSASEPSLVF